MTLANAQLRIATQLQHQLAETHARETFFLPEGFLVAFLTRLFPSGFHVNIPRNP